MKPPRVTAEARRPPTRRRAGSSTLRNGPPDVAAASGAPAFGWRVVVEGVGALTWAVVLLLLTTGCGNMKHQAYLQPEEPASQLPRGTSAQLPPPHTVVHGAQVPDAAFVTGERDGKLLTELPVPLTADLLARGRDRFSVYCAVCHGPDGYGQGIVVRRGFPAPPSYHDPRLRNVPIGHFVQVMARGFGAMYPYADRLTPGDRWAVAAYIRALQLSQRAKVQDLSAQDRANLAGP